MFALAELMVSAVVGGAGGRIVQTVKDTWGCNSGQGKFRQVPGGIFVRRPRSMAPCG